MAYTNNTSGKRGEIITLLPANPAPGAEIAYALPVNFEYNILAVSYKIAASAAAASREPQLVGYDNANQLFVCRVGATVVATVTAVHNFFPGNIMSTTSSVDRSAPLPIGLKMNAGMVIGTKTIALQAADQYSEIRILVERWRI